MPVPVPAIIGLVKGIVALVGKVFVPIAAYFTGKKAARGEAAEASAEQGRKARETAEAVRNLDDASLDSELRGNDK